jgi:hypothetical protein
MKEKIYKKQIGGDHYNAIKYLCRHKQKNQKEDLLKAKHYIDMAIDRDYPEEVKEEIKKKSNSWGIIK